MSASGRPPALTADLEAMNSNFADDPLAMNEAFMPTFCNHVKAELPISRAKGNPDLFGGLDNLKLR
jgi:hypothetical protein